MSTVLHGVVLHLGESRLEAFVVGGDGKKRLIEVRHIAKDPTDVPHPEWFAGVHAEVEEQRTREHDAKIGRGLL